jgi:hypothetical protein
MKSITNVLEPNPLTSDIAPTEPTGRPDWDDSTPPTLLDTDQVQEYPEKYREILRGDIIAKARQLINMCRKSPQRRQSLHKTIIAGKEAKEWECKPLQLLRDVDTRWSSLYLMIDRYLYLYPVSTKPNIWICITDRIHQGCYSMDPPSRAVRSPQVPSFTR